jgi:hypothetical protein
MRSAALLADPRSARVKQRIDKRCTTPDPPHEPGVSAGQLPSTLAGDHAVGVV